jgi:hypothetical protein
MSEMKRASLKHIGYYTDISGISLTIWMRRGGGHCCGTKMVAFTNFLLILCSGSQFSLNANEVYLIGSSY